MSDIGKQLLAMYEEEMFLEDEVIPLEDWLQNIPGVTYTPPVMTMDEYQTRSRDTYSFIPISGLVEGQEDPGFHQEELIYPTLGMLNEAGEFVGKLKKVYRDNGGEFTDEIRAMLKGEIGDVLWYWAQVVTNLGFTMDEVARANLEKLADRAERGVIRGDGDER